MIKTGQHEVCTDVKISPWPYMYLKQLKLVTSAARPSLQGDEMDVSFKAW